MLTVLVTLWGASLVVLTVTLVAVIAGQATLGRLRRLGASWRARAGHRSQPVQPALAGRAGR